MCLVPAEMLYRLLVMLNTATEWQVSTPPCAHPPVALTEPGRQIRCFRWMRIAGAANLGVVLIGRYRDFVVGAATGGRGEACFRPADMAAYASRDAVVPLSVHA